MKRKALFLDRDGVINKDKGYLYHPKDVEWVPGIFDLMTRFQDAGYLLIVITNQSGIARGYYDKADFLHLMQWIKAQLEKHDIHIDDVFYCPHHPDYEEPANTPCECRKPRPGMLFDAISKWDIDPQHSVFIGDSWRDMMAGEYANVARLIFCGDSTKGEKESTEHPLQSNIEFEMLFTRVMP